MDTLFTTPYFSFLICTVRGLGPSKPRDFFYRYKRYDMNDKTGPGNQRAGGLLAALNGHRNEAAPGVFGGTDLMVSPPCSKSCRGTPELLE